MAGSENAVDDIQNSCFGSLVILVGILGNVIFLITSIVLN